MEGLTKSDHNHRLTLMCLMFSSDNSHQKVEEVSIKKPASRTSDQLNCSYNNEIASVILTNSDHKHAVVSLLSEVSNIGLVVCIINSQ